jgi:hypothetical protein
VPRGLSASASYVLSRVTERIDGREVPRARDQRHALGVDVAWAPDDRWRVSAAWQYRSGWPRTSHEYEIERLRDGRPYIHWSYGPYNDDRLPSYHRLDTRLTRHIDAGSGRVSIYLDVFNVYDRMNPRSIILYASVNSRGQVVRRERTERLLPRLPSLGVVWEF